MSLFSPNLKVLKDWRGTLNVAFSALRRVTFVIESTFSFGNFDPNINWHGMTVTAINVRKARYLKIYKFLWVSVDIQGTLAAPLTNTVTITIPGTLAGIDGDLQSCPASVQDNNVRQIGFALGFGTRNTLIFVRESSVNYTAGLARFGINQFYEVI